MMKILIVGRGGREHAIAWKIAQSPLHPELFIAPGSPGMLMAKGTSTSIQTVPIVENDIESLVAFARQQHIDLTIVGPEAALMNGIADEFQKAGLPIFAPLKAAARIEGSKQFAKELMQEYHVPTAAFRTFDDYAQARHYLDSTGVPIVIKYDGLAAGKGVTVAMSHDEADRALQEMLLHNRFGKGKIIMEDFLQGPEFSLLALVNGEQVVPLTIAQDHKRAFDGDNGPNTGGMGAYSPVTVIPDNQVNHAVEHIMKPVAKALSDKGCPFCGVLYGGLILTDEGPKVIEFNARFGDPETEVILPALKNDLLKMILDLMAHDEVKPVFDDIFHLGVVMAAKGYPGKCEKGHVLRGLNRVQQTVFHMGTNFKNNQWVSNGGRVLIVVGKGRTLQEAQHDAYEGIEKIDCPELFYRKDIGWQSL